MANDQGLGEIFDSTENLFGLLKSFDNNKGRFLSPLEEALSPRGSTTELGSPLPRKRNRTEESEPVEAPRMSHITVERNRRKQMNEHLSALKSLMPCFYLKRGDQASIIGGVVEYIKELQQVLQSLEAKKRRIACNEVLSPRISPRTPLPDSPFNQRICTSFLSPILSPRIEPLKGNNGVDDLAAKSSSAVAYVEVKVLGPNVVLKTISPPIPRQVLRIVSALDRLALEILQVEVNTLDERVESSFTIKIGIECELSAEDLANEVQQTFS